MDTRGHMRFPVHFNSHIASSLDVKGAGIAMDLSVGGCRIASMTRVEPGTLLRLHIAIDEGPEPIEIAQAVARWVRDDQFGVEFLEVREEICEQINHLIKMLLNLR